MTDRPSFIVMSEVRTGGTVLMDSLAGHPQLAVLGEIFDIGPCPFWKDFRRPLVNFVYGHLNDITPQSDLIPFIDYLLRHYNGFMIHRQWQIDDNNPAWEYLASRPGLKVIHLYRENLLKQYLSEQLAIASNVWHLVGPEAQRPNWKPLKVDCEACLTMMRQKRLSMERACALFVSRSSLTIRYEEIESDIQRVLSDCQKFLGVEYTPLPVNHRKLTNKSVTDLVMNVDELRRRLDGTEFPLSFID